MNKITKEDILNSEIGKELMIEFHKKAYNGFIGDNYMDNLYSDFKQEQLKPKVDWEIISFKQDSGITDLWTYFPNYGWARNNNGHRETAAYKTLDAILNNHIPDEDNNKGIKYNIYSVKRLSDNCIFTLGDRVNFGKNGTITKFSTSSVNDGLCVDIEFNKLESYCNAEIKSITKVTPLFKDFFGNDVAIEGDTVYRVELKLNTITPYYNCSKMMSPLKEYQYFKNKSDAEEYLLMHSKVLSLSEIKYYQCNPTNLTLEEHLKQLIRKKLNLK